MGHGKVGAECCLGSNLVKGGEVRGLQRDQTEEARVRGRGGVETGRCRLGEQVAGEGLRACEF